MTSKELKDKVSKILGSWYVVDISEELGDYRYRWHDVKIFGSALQIKLNVPEITFSITKERILNARFSIMCVEMVISVFVRCWADFLDEANAQLERDRKFEVVD